MRPLTLRSVESLKRMRVTSVSIRDGWISVKLNGKALPRQKINVRRHLYYIGEWGRKKSKVFVDNDVKDMSQRWMKFVAMHEVLEKYFTQNFVARRVAHLIATKLEHDYIRRHYGTSEIKSYEEFLECIYKAELSGRNYRRRKGV